MYMTYNQYDLLDSVFWAMEGKAAHHNDKILSVKE